MRGMAVNGDRHALAVEDLSAAPGVLVVGPDAGSRQKMARALRDAGFDAAEVSTVAAALAAAGDERFDLVVLDTALPDVSGVDALRTLRERADVPVIVIGGNDSDVERVLYLELGADDCLTKPFSLLELVSRGRAVLRRGERGQERRSPVHVVGALRVDIARREVSLHDRPIDVTPSEFEVLALLSGSPGRVFARREIMQHLWAGPYFGDGRAADMHILNLRRKLEGDPSRPVRLLTVRAVGFKLAPAEGDRSVGGS